MVDALHSHQFLRKLHRLINDRAADLLSGKLLFTTNPSCLAYLRVVVDEYDANGEFQSVEGLTPSQLHSVYDFCCQLKALKVEPTQENVVTEGNSVDVTLFAGLQHLHLHNVVPSALFNASLISKRLRALTVKAGVSTIREVLLLNGSEEWPLLKILDLSGEGILEIDRSVAQVATKLTSLNLARNSIAHLDNLDECVFLNALNLSWNRIESVANFVEHVGSLHVLSLRANKLSSTEGLNHLKALQSLDLRDNQLQEFQDLRPLTLLPFLSKLWTLGNPLSFKKDYRSTLLRMFMVEGHREDVAPPLILDGKPSTPDEESEIAAALSTRPIMPDLKVLSVEVEPKFDQSPSSAQSTPIPATPPSGKTPTSSVKRRKKKKKARQAVILDADQSETSVAEALLEKGNLDDSFVETIKQIHEEGGDRWLVVLEGMSEQLTPPSSFEAKKPSQLPKPKISPRKPKSKTKHKKRRKHPNSGVKKSKQPKSPATPKTPVTEVQQEPSSQPSVVTEAQEETEKTGEEEENPEVVTSGPIPDGATMEIVTEERFVLHPATMEVISTEISIGSLVEQTQEEFLVTARNTATGEYSMPRILLLQPNTLLEIAASTGDTVVSLSCRDLTDIDTTEFPGSETILQLTFRIGTQETNQRKVRYYYQVQQEELQKLLPLLEEIVALNAKADKKKMFKCMVCDNLMETAGVCKCGSEYVVSFTQETPVVDAPPSRSRSGTARRSLRQSVSVLKAPIREPEEEEKINYELPDLAEQVEHNLDLHLQLHIYKGGSGEKLCWFQRIPTLKLGADINSENSDTFWLITTLYLYIVQRDPKSSEWGLSLICSNTLSALEELSVGLLHQRFYVRFESDEAYVGVSRSHSNGHKFLDALCKAAPNLKRRQDEETLKQIRDLFRKEHIRFYCMALKKEKTRSRMPWSSKQPSLRPISIIFTGETIAFGKENYSKSNSKGSMYFSDLKTQHLSNIQALGASSHSRELVIVFDEESDQVEEASWTFEFEHAEEKARLELVITEQWEKHFSMAILRHTAEGDIDMPNE